MITFSLLLTSSGIKKVNLNGFDKNLEFELVDLVQYVKLNVLSNFLNPKININEYVLELDDESMTFAISSIYVVYKQHHTLRVAQMSQPCKSRSGEILIPWNAFITALQGIGIINFDYNVGKLILETNIFQINEAEKSEKIIVIPPNRQDTLTGNTYQRIPVKDSAENPKKYVIPKHLVK